MNAAGFLIKQFRQAASKPKFFRSLLLGNKGGTTSVLSSDGTKISVRRSGSGPPLVLVHGTLDGMAAFSFVEPELASEFEVSVYDRRGRGESQDGAGYTIENEVDDLASVIDAAAGAPHVVAHSFGAVVAMLAARRGVEMRSLVLYEPPMNGEAISTDVLADVERLIAAGELDAAIKTMASELAGVTDEELGVALSVPPIRKALREGVLVAPREIAALRAVEWRDLPITNTPTMFMRGAATAVAAYPTDEQAERVVVNSHVVSIADQGHLAHTFAPQAFLAEIKKFIGDH